jgi:hypothetical protein
MADGGRTGIDERDPMEDLRRSVDESLLPNASSDGQPETTTAEVPPTHPPSIADGGYHDSELHDPPVSTGDTE